MTLFPFFYHSGPVFQKSIFYYFFSDFLWFCDRFSDSHYFLLIFHFKNPLLTKKSVFLPFWPRFSNKYIFLFFFRFFVILWPIFVFLWPFLLIFLFKTPFWPNFDQKRAFPFLCRNGTFFGRTLFFYFFFVFFAIFLTDFEILTIFC